MAKVNNMMQIYWRVDQSALNAVDLGIRPATEMAVKQTLEDMRDYIRNHWSPNSPSKSGEPPAVVTGNLDKSLRVDRRDKGGHFSNTENAVSYELRVEAEYGAALEFGVPERNLAARPFLRPAIQEAKKNFGKYLITMFNFVKPRGVYEVIHPFSAQSSYTLNELERLG